MENIKKYRDYLMEKNKKLQKLALKDIMHMFETPYVYLKDIGGGRRISIDKITKYVKNRNRDFYSSFNFIMVNFKQSEALFTSLYWNHAQKEI